MLDLEARGDAQGAFDHLALDGIRPDEVSVTDIAGVGAFVIAFSVLVPMMPGMSMEGMMDPKVVPPGWTYCPSTGAQRLPIAALGLIGLLISRMLTAYQLGHVDYAWEPFFGGNLADPRNGSAPLSWDTKVR